MYRLPFSAATVLSCAALVCGLGSVVSCVGGDAPMETPLGSPMPSDGAHYTVTVDATGGGFRVGTNSLSVRVQATGGSPAVLTRVTAYMPAHSHSSDAPQITSLGNGSFDVQALNLTMPGQWLISLKLSHDGTIEDDAATVWADPQ